MVNSSHFCFHLAYHWPYSFDLFLSIFAFSFSNYVFYFYRLTVCPFLHHLLLLTFPQSNKMATSSSTFAISTLRVFDEENYRFILDPTLQDPEQGPTIIDPPPQIRASFRFSVAPHFSVPSEIHLWPKPSTQYTQWLNQVMNEKGEEWKE